MNKKFIAYINHEYLERIYQEQGEDTLEAKDNIRHHIFDVVNRFLRNDSNQSVLMCDTFTNSKGELTKFVEIYNIENGAKIKNLKELRQLMDKQKKRIFEELKRDR